jgi:hypothetical protein
MNTSVLENATGPIITGKEHQAGLRSLTTNKPAHLGTILLVEESIR